MNQPIQTTANGGPIKLKSTAMFPIWNRLDAYIFSEIHFPFLMSMLFYNGMFFINIIGKASDLSGGKFEIPLSLSAIFFLSEMPETLFLTTSISFLFAALATMGRMSADSEVVALLSSGVSPWRLNRPILAYGALLSLMLFFSYNLAGPWLNRLWQFRYRDFIENVALPNIEPGVINPIGKDSVLYVDRLEQGKLADLLFINQSTREEDILLARHASIYRNRDMALFNYINIKLRLDGSKGPEIFWAEEMARSIPLPRDFSEKDTRSSFRDISNTQQLYAMYRANPRGDPELGNELFRRLLTPFICLIMALFATPLAAKHSRFKTGSGFGLSLLIMAGYFFLAKLGRDASSQGQLTPMAGIGVPLLVFLVFGALLQIGKNLWWSQYFRRMGEGIASMRARLAVFTNRLLNFRRRVRAKSRLRARRRRDAPAHTLLFPSKLDLYIIKSFCAIYLLVQCSVLLIFYLVDYAGISKAVLRNDVGMDQVARYFLAQAPAVLDLTMSLCLLIAVLILLAVMSRNQEITVIRASGGSLQRLCLPLLFCGALASGLSYYMHRSFLPQTNRIALGLRNRIKDKKETLFSRDVWLKTYKGDLLNYRFFDQRGNRLVGVRYYRGNQTAGPLIERIQLPSLIYQSGWRAESQGGAWRFSRDAQGAVAARPFTVAEGTEFDLNLDPGELSQKKRRASEFSVQELKEYLKYLKGLGYSEDHYQTELYAKYAQPLFPLVMILLAMPLGIQFGRRGAFYGVGMGLAAGLVFWGVFELLKGFGTMGLMHPLAAAWTAVVIFGFLALYRFINLE